MLIYIFCRDSHKISLALSDMMFSDTPDGVRERVAQLASRGPGKAVPNAKPIAHTATIDLGMPEPGASVVPAEAVRDYQLPVDLSPPKPAHRARFIADHFRNMARKL